MAGDTALVCTTVCRGVHLYVRLCVQEGTCMYDSVSWCALVCTKVCTGVHLYVQQCALVCTTMCPGAYLYVRQYVQVALVCTTVCTGVGKRLHTLGEPQGFELLDACIKQQTTHKRSESELPKKLGTRPKNSYSKRSKRLGKDRGRYIVRCFLILRTV